MPASRHCPSVGQGSFEAVFNIPLLLSRLRTQCLAEELLHFLKETFPADACDWLDG